MPRPAAPATATSQGKSGVNDGSSFCRRRFGDFALPERVHGRQARPGAALAANRGVRHGARRALRPARAGRRHQQAAPHPRRRRPLRQFSWPVAALSAKTSSLALRVSPSRHRLDAHKKSRDCSRPWPWIARTTQARRRFTAPPTNTIPTSSNNTADGSGTAASGAPKIWPPYAPPLTR